jgi:hypothetical protein
MTREISDGIVIVRKGSERCDSCLFWDNEEYQTHHPQKPKMGRCRKHAPRPAINVWFEEEIERIRKPVVSFAETYNYEWCGEWEDSTPLKNKTLLGMLIHILRKWRK